MPCRIAALVLLLPLSAAAADPLTVELQSGRTFTAPVDARTDDSTLWLRFEGRSAQLLRPIAWEAVAAAHFQGRPVPLSQLPTLANSVKDDARLIDDGAYDHTDASAGAETARRILFTAPPVASLDFHAALSNWDADADVDGLLLRVAPLDAWGRLAPAPLRLEVTLEANRADSNNTLGSGPLRKVRTWVAAVSAEQVAQGRPVQLPLAASQSPTWGAVGRLHVRAVADGAGVFEARQAVRLRDTMP